MFYYSKPRASDGRLVPYEDSDQPVEQGEVEQYDDYAGWITSQIEDGSEATKLAAQVIESRINWKDIRKAIEDKKFRAEFSKKMKEVRDAVEEDMQGSRVHTVV